VNPELAPMIQKMLGPVEESSKQKITEALLRISEIDQSSYTQALKILQEMVALSTLVIDKNLDQNLVELAIENQLQSLLLIEARLKVESEKARYRQAIANIRAAFDLVFAAITVALSLYGAEDGGGALKTLVQQLLPEQLQ
jgi:hypothetical protein